MKTTTEDEAKLEAERKYRREYMRRYLAKKRAEDPAYRAKMVARAKAYYDVKSLEPGWREKKNARRMELFKERYAGDPEFKQKVNQRGREQRVRYGQDWRRADRLKRDYGITAEAYRAMHSAQGGGCAICTRISDEWLHVDHEHVAGFWDMPATEKAKFVRGLLCKDCNNGIGKLGDDPARLRAAADYLETSKR